MKLDTTAGLPQAVAKQVPAFREATKRSPEHTLNAFLPVMLSFSVGLAAFVAVGLISIGWHWPVKVPLTAAGILMLLVMCAGGWWLVKDKILWTTEHIIGHVPSQEMLQPATVVKTYFGLRSGGYVKYGEVDLDPALLIEWCRAACSNQSLAINRWKSQFALPDGTKGRERYEAFRDWLIGQGYAEDAGGNVGLRILWRNQDAVTFVAGFAEEEPENGTPLLTPGNAGASSYTRAGTLTHTGTLENVE